jgi:hypothetical protein
MIILRATRWAGHIDGVCMGNIRNIYKILIEKPEEK